MIYRFPVRDCVPYSFTGNLTRTSVEPTNVCKVTYKLCTQVMSRISNFVIYVEKLMFHLFFRYRLSLIFKNILL